MSFSFPPHCSFFSKSDNKMSATSSAGHSTQLFRKKTAIAALFSTLLIGTVSGSFFFRPAAQFNRAAEQLFRDEMTASTLNMHYTIAFPENYDITEYQAILPPYTKDSRQNSIASLQEQIAFYRKLDPSGLEMQDAHTLTLLLAYLESSLRLAEYPYHEEPLSPSSGMQSQLPILLAEYAFRSRRDVEDYLSILSQTGTYFDSLLLFEAEKKEAGLLMAASSLHNTVKQCRTILTKDLLDKEEHFLQITFRNRLQELCERGMIADAEIPVYIQKNNQILSKILLPAYERLADGLTALADPAIILEGLAAKPDGAAYYEALLQSETGSCHSVDEIRQLLTDQLQTEYARLCTLLQETDPAYLTEEAYETCNELFPLKNCGEMLNDLRDRSEGLFPQFPDAGQETPSIRIKEVDPCLQDYCAPAFYLTPPLDDTVNNSIYINTKTTISNLDLYTTLAHEGFPGHMYQTVYQNRLLSKQQGNPVQQLIWFGGYLEGWALYVEFMAYDYASQVIMESDGAGVDTAVPLDNGLSEYAALIQIEKHNRATQLCLYSLLDLLIHYDNLDLQGTADLLAQFGITNSASVSAIYEYIVEEPANYPKYYLGYLEILLLKENCREAWGDDYSDYAFHKFFLEKGPADFGTLNNLVNTSRQP